MASSSLGKRKSAGTGPALWRFCMNHQNSRAWAFVKGRNRDCEGQWMRGLSQKAESLVSFISRTRGAAVLRPCNGRREAWVGWI
jgi:hypothetical protein